MFISKNYTFVGICLFIALGLVLYFSGQPVVKKSVPSASVGAHTLSAQSSESQALPKNKEVVTQIQGSGNVNAASNKLSGDGAKPFKAMSAAERAILDDWIHHNNYATNAHNPAYASYSVDELKKLALAGDANALAQLNSASFFEDVDDRINFNMLAAVHGSTPAIGWVSLALASTNYADAVSPEEKKLAAIKVLAWENVATLRGDRFFKVFRGFSRDLERDGIKLTSDDYQAVTDISKNIYNSLQQKRTELGLGEFDNTEPEAVKKYFDDLEVEFKLRK